jgi:hypothetical protein
MPWIEITAFNTDMLRVTGVQWKSDNGRFHETYFAEVHSIYDDGATRFEEASRALTRDDLDFRMTEFVATYRRLFKLPPLESVSWMRCPSS